MSHQPELPDGQDVQEQRLDPNLISNRHEWNLFPVSGLTMRNNIEQETDPRTDIARYKIIAADNRAIAKKYFSEYCRPPTLFRIPHSLHCDRTYARDNEEAYYLDAMDIYLSGEPGDLDVNDIPLLRRRTHSRMFCGFGRKPGYRSETFERRRLRIWLFHDALENEYFSDAELSALHPKLEEWYDEVYFPPALPIPAPFVYYYYHKELRAAQVHPDLGDSERIRRMRFCGRKEYYTLGIAMWCNDVFYGGKLFILDLATIQVLERECGTIPIIAGKPTQAIFEHMKMAAQLPTSYHNWMLFRDGCMEPSPFVFCVKKHGRVDYSQPTGRKFYCDRLKRGITKTRYGSSIFKRVSVMDRRLSAPDLDIVQGLIGLVDSQGWRAHGSLRVGDLVYHLLTLYRHTEARVGDTERELHAARRELDFMRRDLQEKDRRLWDTERRLDDTRWRLDERERSLFDSNRRLDDARRRLSELDTAQPALRSTPVQERRVKRLQDPYGRQEVRRNQTPLHATVYGDTTQNRNASAQQAGSAAMPHSPHYSPPARDVGEASAAQPIPEIDLVRTPAQAGPSDAVTSLPPVTPATPAPGGTPAQASRPSTPAQASTQNKVRSSRGYLFFKKLPSGNVPWIANKDGKKRAHSEMNAGTPVTVAEGGTGTPSTPNAAPTKRSRLEAGPSAGPSTQRETSQPTQPTRNATETDPVLTTLLDRHPRNTALALREDMRQREEERREKDEDGSGS